MSTRHVLAAALVVGTAGAVPGFAAPPEDNAKQTAEFFKIRSALAGRHNGARLEATATADGDRVAVRWTLGYDGPRPPLVILEPSLDRPTAGQTEVLVYAVGRNGKVYEQRFASPPRLPGAGADGQPQKGVAFVTVPKGERAAGVIALPLADLRGHCRTNWPDQFEERTPPPLRVQLVHAPKDRGDVGGSLDAWTGILHTEVIPVEKLTKW